MPSIAPLPTAARPIVATPVEVGDPPSPFRLAGAWSLESPDRRLRGISGLAIDGEGLRAISDLGAAVRLDAPNGAAQAAAFADLRDGPGRFGYKIHRDAEAVTTDGQGGWLVAFEQRHSLWRYDRDFAHSYQLAPIDRPWANNGGAEAILRRDGQIVVFSQAGDEVLTLSGGRWIGRPLETGGWEVADAAMAPDGATWLLLRRFGMRGFENALAPLAERNGAFAVGSVTPVPKGWSDNLEGLAIAQQSDGLRFWLISDDGHRIFARTLLIALDLPLTQENARL
ncbi:esterase-like activity of phytase family protein [Sphingomonas jaspsi]|uniref:esterase-like activity of phytase family protein n=1 Tax=Sphingomonas jaspsi TaxID=392409 RepID=UPI0004B6C450|nr:esterase-like activity of phytase family protein [Sphingomonas jaspsi]